MLRTLFSSGSPFVSRSRWATVTLVTRAAGAARVACAALALTMLPACASKPSLSVHHAEVRGGSTSGLGVVVYLELENGNAVDIEIRNVRAQVTMEGGYRLSSIDVSPNKWLPAGRTTQIAVPMSIPWSVVPRLLASTTGSSEIGYHIRGSADVTAGRSVQIRRNNVPLDESGTIPRRLVANAARGGLPF